MSVDDIRYSDKYEDDNYIYRHVMLPLSLAKQVPKTHQMTETEWRNLGVQQSPGWVHYMLHLPGNLMCYCSEEQNILLLNPVLVIHPQHRKKAH
ncbi:hypothetical protein WDU94_014383 [Cyamophila willieti]